MKKKVFFGLGEGSRKIEGTEFTMQENDIQKLFPVYNHLFWMVVHSTSESSNYLCLHLPLTNYNTGEVDETAFTFMSTCTVMTSFIGKHME